MTELLPNDPLFYPALPDGIVCPCCEAAKFQGKLDTFERLKQLRNDAQLIIKSVLVDKQQAAVLTILEEAAAQVKVILLPQ